MEYAIKRILDSCRNASAFSPAIDVTNVSGVMDFLTSIKAKHGGAYPNHNISTIMPTSEGIKMIVNHITTAEIIVDIAEEVKVGIMVFAHSPSKTSPFEIVAT